MRYLSIDLGQRRIGLAISDEMEMFASPYATIERRRLGDDINEIIALIRGLGAEAIVIGLPRRAEGTSLHHEEAIKEFSAALEKRLEAENLPMEIEWWDERFSTAEALKQMRAAGISQRRGRNSTGSDSVDAMAAAVILQGFLDARRMRSGMDDELPVSEPRP